MPLYLFIPKKSTESRSDTRAAYDALISFQKCFTENATFVIVQRLTSAENSPLKVHQECRQ
jgi:hypothetical protein